MPITISFSAGEGLALLWTDTDGRIMWRAPPACIHLAGPTPPDPRREAEARQLAYYRLGMEDQR